MWWRQVAGAGAGAGAVSWLCTWWRQVAGAGPGAGAGGGAVSWLCTWWGQVAGAGAGCRYWCCELAVHVVETGCWCWCRVPVLVPASDSEVITTAASDSEG